MPQYLIKTLTFSSNGCKLTETENNVIELMFVTNIVNFFFLHSNWNLSFSIGLEAYDSGTC